MAGSACEQWRCAGRVLCDNGQSTVVTNAAYFFSYNHLVDIA